MISHARGWSHPWARLPTGSWERSLRSMTSAGLALFVFVGFLVPVPILHWLDAVRNGPGEGSD